MITYSKGVIFINESDFNKQCTEGLPNVFYVCKFRADKRPSQFPCVYRLEAPSMRNLDGRATLLEDWKIDRDLIENEIGTQSEQYKIKIKIFEETLDKLRKA